MSVTTVGDLMTENVERLVDEQNVFIAEDLMRKGNLRHLPVTRAGKIVGLVTHRDLLHAQARIMEQVGQGKERPSIRARDVMTTNVITVTKETKAAEAARILIDKKYGCLPVVDGDNQLIGIITETDFLRWAMDELRRAGA